jgi:hypothetical protein
MESEKAIYVAYKQPLPAATKSTPITILCGRLELAAAAPERRILMLGTQVIWVMSIRAA